ncbi:PC-Esterase [Artemisia annua]|uniref:PC-Esterase n=1 Tax=Artemisia annua TaxID=35608 RepID=A0A2U1KPY3_ARTAN|nr:PC-Esterase [Artemisia annua]
MAKKQHSIEIWDVNHRFESSLLIFFITGALATTCIYYANIQEHSIHVTPTVVHRTTNAYDLLDGCDLFSGKWVYDNESYPLYKELDCPYISGEFACVQYGRMDSMYRQWRWQPQACNLPRFDARIILERLSGKRILFVGDSLNRNQFESMVCMLQTIIPIGQKSLQKVPDVSLITFKELLSNKSYVFFGQ